MTDELKPCPLTWAIQRLNSTPYSLTKDECVDVLRGLRDEIRALAAAQPAQAGEVDAKCQTCNGHGLVGGHMQDGSGYGEGCPDCNPEPAPLVKWASTQPAAQATPEPVGEARCSTCGVTMNEPHHPACGAVTAAIIGLNTMAAQDKEARRRELAEKIRETLRGVFTHPAPGVPDVLFDGFAVLKALTPQAERRTSAENVSDVLDAAVRLIRAAQAKGGAHG